MITSIEKNQEAPEPGREPGSISRRIFSSRLLIGLVFAALGAVLARPHTLWGAHELAGVLGSALFLIAGMALRFWAAGSAGDHTHSETIEGGALATGGPYAYVRNPIYLGSIILGFGMVGLIGDARLLPLLGMAFGLLYGVIIPAEERFLARSFGVDYAAFCKGVPRLIPRLSPWAGRKERRFHWGVARGELRLALALVAIYAAMELAVWLRAALHASG